MWVVLSPIPATPFLCISARQPLRTVSRSATPENDGVYYEDIGGVGHTLLTNDLKSSSSRHKQADGQQLSGSDVLWALRRAATAKKKKKNSKTRKEFSSADYGNVKPLCINPEWATKLDELDKRLQELSEFNFLL